MQELDLQYAPIGVNPVVHVSQFDVGRQFRLKIYDGAEAYSMPSGTTARIDGIKPDKKGFSYSDAVSVNGNIVTVTTKQQMTIVSGTVVCEIRFINAGNTIGTLNFKMEVEPSPVNENTDISETDLPEIFELATEQMLEAEAWARGTKNGVDVDDTEPQYHNNSKYYSEQTDSIGQYWDNKIRSDGIHWDTVIISDGVDWDGKIISDGQQYASESKANADASALSASRSYNSAKLSESWAVGGTNLRQGEETNNSKYWCNRSRLSAEDFENLKPFLMLLLDSLSIYVSTEDGMNLITESGDKIIAEY